MVRVDLIGLDIKDQTALDNLLRACGTTGLVSVARNVKTGVFSKLRDGNKYRLQPTLAVKKRKARSGVTAQ